jgi:hypothetical protein
LIVIAGIGHPLFRLKAGFDVQIEILFRHSAEFGLSSFGLFKHLLDFRQIDLLIGIIGIIDVKSISDAYRHRGRIPDLQVFHPQAGSVSSSWVNHRPYQGPDQSLHHRRRPW